jgi:hypothetical protein
VHQDQRDQKDRPEYGEADQVQRPVHGARQYQVSQRRRADDEADAQQQVATDPGTIPGEMRAPEAALQIGIVERQAWKAALEL